MCPNKEYKIDFFKQKTIWTYFFILYKIFWMLLTISNSDKNNMFKDN